MNRIRSIPALEALYGATVPLAVTKERPRLTPLYRQWIEGARFCILCTAGAEGVHGTPRGDAGPVVRVLDDETLLMPDWMGNNRIEALRDIVTDGRVALLFMVPGSTTTVRVNGTAFLTDDAALRESFAKGARQPATVIVIAVAQVYTQCAKALLRSGLWNRDDRDSVPTTGAILAEITGGAEGGTDYDTHYAERAKPRMW
ncbi:pyridoxamine 5'-phosphate oxidase family protein [Sagittula salina]|uniref:Pyridoxamine 5'-phosphate oxidase family protein n=1 Tax=Sagittula salina TaxID=2820268 RepID=A0A940RZ15_9RHOB|nr:pyridoxamine 5'-phosphate oxidase family protein [Sagittula salina]MBP0481488.1 pyridoxamine 5'-phosphate oxidase family protein [Sagittula salina]